MQPGSWLSLVPPGGCSWACCWMDDLGLGDDLELLDVDAEGNRQALVPGLFGQHEQAGERAEFLLALGLIGEQLRLARLAGAQR
jgi:hypothetical protein